MNNTSKSDRLNALILYYSEGKKAHFANMIGVSPSTINAWITRDTYDIELLFTKCKHISASWLISGEGDMLNKPEENATIISKGNAIQASSEQEIPLYDVSAAAGCVMLFQDTNGIVPVDTIKIPNLAKCDGAIFARGDSMYPIIKSGDIILYKIMQGLDTIMWGETYIVCYELYGDYYTVVKYVKRSTHHDGNVVLISQNEHHQPFEIHISQIKSMALVRASVRYNNM